MTAKLIDECTFAVVDVETTGIDPSRDRIVEIAVLTCDRAGRPLARYETLVRPDLTPLVGRRAEMLDGAPTFAEVAGDVIGPLAGHVVAGHNVSFDLRMIDAELGRLGAHLPSLRYICTRELATLLGCDVPNRTLAALCAHFGVPFERWHTAADDTAATAEVLVRLLDRATGFGRVALSAVDQRWAGIGSEWPLIAPGGPVMVRDVTRWPPTGDKPGSKRATEASFRRLGEGPASPSGAVVVQGPDSGGASASELWWQSELRGLDGIAQLESTIVPSFRAADDPELLNALLALADLLRRHGGRDQDVRLTLADALTEARRRDDSDAVAVVAAQWWGYLSDLRDTRAMAALAVQHQDDGFDALALVTDQMARSRTAEPLVAERLALDTVAALTGCGRQGRAWPIVAALADTLRYVGRTAEADARLQQAWEQGCAHPIVLDRLSGRLEEEGDHGRAVEVCARALGGAHAADPATAASLAALRKRYRRCQERLAKAATLFG